MRAPSGTWMAAHRVCTRGFTFVELLVTTSLMALVGAATVAALSGGVRVWERARESAGGGRSSLVAFDRLRRDVRNVRRFTPVPFDGAYDQFEAAAVEASNKEATPIGSDDSVSQETQIIADDIRGYPRKDQRASASHRANMSQYPPIPELGRLGYYLDERRHVLCRSFVPYRLMRRERLTDRCQAVLEDVARLRFRYFGTLREDDEPEWMEHWDLAQPPLAIECAITLQAAGRPAAPQTLRVVLPNAALPEASK